MAYEIEKAKQEIERTYNGKRVRTSKEELARILAPMFATFQGLAMSAETFGMYHMMLADLDPAKLELAVINACGLHKYPTQLITVAAIREAYEGEARAPGADSQVSKEQMSKPVPTTMFRLDPEEDKRQRMAQLRRTAGWVY